MSIVVMKRKAKAKSRPVSRGGFSLNGGYRNRGGIGRPTFATRCSANDPSIIKNSTKSSKGYEATRMLCCDPIVAAVNGETSQSEQLEAKIACHIQCQDTRPAPNECAELYVERKNGQNGAPYESYDEYIRKGRCDCK